MYFFPCTEFIAGWQNCKYYQLVSLHGVLCACKFSIRQRVYGPLLNWSDSATKLFINSSMVELLYSPGSPLTFQRLLDSCHTTNIPLFAHPLPVPPPHLSAIFHRLSPANIFLLENKYETNLWQGSPGKCDVIGQFKNSCLVRIFHKHPETKKFFWILFGLLTEFCSALVV